MAASESDRRGLLAMLLWLLKIAVFAYLGLGLYLYLAQRSLMYFPVSDHDGPDAQVEYLANEGESIKLWVVGPHSERAVIYFGGNAEDVYANAADFRGHHPTSVIEAHLCRQAVANAVRIERSLRLGPLIRQKVIQSVALALLGVLIPALAAIGLKPVVTAVWPRLFDPLGDHPPYSRLKLRVTPGNTSVLYAGRLDVRVEATGRAVSGSALFSESSQNVGWGQVGERAHRPQPQPHQDITEIFPVENPYCPHPGKGLCPEALLPVLLERPYQGACPGCQEIHARVVPGHADGEIGGCQVREKIGGKPAHPNLGRRTLLQAVHICCVHVGTCKERQEKGRIRLKQGKRLDRCM